MGIVYNPERSSILLCKRPEGSSQGGLWELPGGKVAPGESELTALKREFFEEVDIHVNEAHPLIKISHDYPEVMICLSAWVIDSWSGAPWGKQGQTVEWVSLQEIAGRQLPEANTRITKAISLPRLYLITPDLASYEDSFLKLTEQLVGNGLRLLQFRSKSSSFNQHRGFVKELVEVCRKGACQLVYNGTVDDALSVGAHGVHLQSNELLKLDNRPVSHDVLFSGSCHNEKEIEHSIRLNLDFCVISPVYQTSSHLGSKGMGWSRFQELAKQSCIPVYALGGLKSEHLKNANRNCAHGIAMISGVWSAPDPVEVVCKLNTNDIY